MKLVQPEELITPELGIHERAQLLTALNTVMMRVGVVTVAIAYKKQTDSKIRREDQDYVSLPGVSRGAQFGELTSVFRRSKDGAVRFRIKSLSRGDGVKPTGYTTVIPEGIQSFKITGFEPAYEAHEMEVVS